MARRYQVFDVFTDHPLAGNPLAVVLEADGLDSAAMQSIAREFNLSETVFVQPPDNPAHTARVRIFTPARELPFAGHPTVGAAVCLARERSALPGEHNAVIVLEEIVGPVRCGVRVTGPGGFAEFDCPKLPEVSGDGAGKAFIAAAIGVAPADVGFENHVPTKWSAGVPYHFVPLHDMAVLRKAVPNSAQWQQAFGKDAGYFYTRQTEGHAHSFRARMFAPEIGIAEDPATGSAAAAFAGVVHRFDSPPDGEHAAVIEQGFEMGRPSLIRLEMSVSAGRLSAVRIGGGAVAVAAGTLMV
jgi:trans-2,3-dihydro-3-hydroxyanthranilate isomerase